MPNGFISDADSRNRIAGLQNLLASGERSNTLCPEKESPFASFSLRWGTPAGTTQIAPYPFYELFAEPASQEDKIDSFLQVIQNLDDLNSIPKGQKKRVLWKFPKERS